MTPTDAATLAKHFLAMYNESSESPRTSATFHRDYWHRYVQVAGAKKLFGIANRRPARRFDQLEEGETAEENDLAPYHGQVYAAYEGPERHPAPYIFLDECPAQRASVRADGDRLRIDFLFVVEYPPGTHPANTEGSGETIDASLPVRLPAAVGVPTQVALECLQNLDRFLGEDGDDGAVPWEHHLHLFTLPEYTAAIASGDYE